MKSDSILRKTNILLDALYPKQCVCCNVLIDSEEELCDNCIRNIERIDTNKRCLKCGLEKDNCQCKLYAYHFEGCVAPFYNDGLAKNGIYDYKLKRRRHYGIFYAREIAKTVRSELKDINFDAVVYVPTSVKSLNSKGFNHSLVLAENVAELLELPLIKNALLRRRAFLSQHKHGRLIRFEIARKIYAFNENEKAKLKNKTVLLVDDIKTTGATLDECARQLLFAGAKRVFCATAVITEFKNQKGTKKAKKFNLVKALQKFSKNVG